MNSKSKILLVGTAVLAGLFGCQEPSREGAMVAQKIDSQMAPNATIHLNQVVILDRDLQDTPGATKRAGKITVERQGGTRLTTGAMEVYATFRNRTDFPLQLECRTQFFGSQQEPVEGPSAWQRVMLPPLGITTFKGASLAFNNIEYYYIEVREGR
jgi:hypothetical protein